LGVYLDDVALDGVLYDNRQGCLNLGANKRQIAFGPLCLGASNTLCPYSSCLPTKVNSTKHCRYVVPTEIKLRPVLDYGIKNSFGNGKTATVTANSWRTVPKKQSARDTIFRRTTEDNQGGGDQRDNLCLQKGYLDVRFMFGTESTAASATFNLARSFKAFIIAGRKCDENFCLLPLYGDENPISKPQDVPNSKDVITVYYRHRLAGNNVTSKNKIQSTSMIAQMKHATSTFKEYLMKDWVHINNAQLGPEESVVLGWIPGSHPAFSF
jgi:hypothetical protein